MAIGIETHAGIEWLGSISPGAAAAAAIEIGIAFIESHRVKSGNACAIFPTRASRRSARPCRSRLDGLHENPPKANASLESPHRFDGTWRQRFAVGIAAPFGRVETDQLRKLAEVIAAHGVAEIRLSPWRALYAGVPSRQSAQEHSRCRSSATV